MKLAGKTALLTGATGGLGEAIARHLHAKGARLVLSGRRADRLGALAAELDARAVAVDLERPGEPERLAREAGEIDVFVANAGLPAAGWLTSFTIEQIDRALAVNLRAPAVLTRELVPTMTARGGGHIVFMSSLSGKAGTIGTSVYCATKFALRGFALALRAELREEGIGVSVIYPGFIRDAGMFADAGVKLPPGVGTRSPEQVARAVARAIERNKAEIDVAPLGLRAGTAFTALAPELAARTTRLIGGARTAKQFEVGQAGKR